MRSSFAADRLMGLGRKVERVANTSSRRSRSGLAWNPEFLVEAESNDADRRQAVYSVPIQVVEIPLLG